MVIYRHKCHFLGDMMGKPILDYDYRLATAFISYLIFFFSCVSVFGTMVSFCQPNFYLFLSGFKTVGFSISKSSVLIGSDLGSGQWSRRYKISAREYICLGLGSEKNGV